MLTKLLVYLLHQVTGLQDLASLARGYKSSAHASGILGEITALVCLLACLLLLLLFNVKYHFSIPV